jgi:protein-S-isoprenylcysteine O-methyltransferase Ste14
MESYGDAARVASFALTEPLHDFPGFLLAFVITAYWVYVGAMAVRLRRKTRKLSGVVPEQALERAMWLIWVPLVIAWMVLPWRAWSHPRGALAPMAFAGADAYQALRWVAALAALVALATTLRVWRQMGRNWTMAVTREQPNELIVEGMFARVRHPIYALSIALMLCTLVVVPAWPVLLIAVVHWVLMNIKARNEEAFLGGIHGAKYADYCARTGRFVPPLGRRTP